MSKKRKPLVEEILKVHESMHLLEFAGISDARIKRPIDKMDKKTYDDIRKLRTWICRIRDNEYGALIKIHKLHTQEKWNWFAEMEIYDLEEQRLLREAKKVLDEAWGHKPKRKKKSAKGRSRKKTNSAS